MRSSFDIYDYQQTVQSLTVYNQTKQQDIDDYILRKRKAELRQLVRKVIKNELSELDRQLVDLHWYQGKSKQEIAQITGLDRSTVFRHFEKINNIIYEKLKYAIEYRFGSDFELKADVLVKSDVKNQASLGSVESIGIRLKNLREKHFLTYEDVFDMTGIKPCRLIAIEKRGKEMTMVELKKLSAFYKVSADQIIFGEERIKGYAS